jgi:hypothetical protein
VTAWVTGAAILAQAGVTSPTAGETSWADACAKAVSAGIDGRLCWDDRPVTSPPWAPSQAATDEITANALLAGAEAYARRQAPFGVTSYQDLQGAAVRVARDYLDGIGPQLDRWRYVAAGIA